MPFQLHCLILCGEKGHFLNEQYKSPATKGSSRSKLFCLGKPFFQHRRLRAEEGSSLGEGRQWVSGTSGCEPAALSTCGEQPHPCSALHFPTQKGDTQPRTELFYTDRGVKPFSSRPFNHILLLDGGRNKPKITFSHQKDVGQFLCEIAESIFSP